MQRTHQRLLQAATKQFSSYGFRHTTMEGIAAEAQVAKATAYAHFANKEEVFEAVIIHVAQDFVARAEEAAAQAPTPVAAVLASLTTKQLQMYALVHSSPHAAELLEAVARAQGGEAVHTRYVDSLERWLGRCASVGPQRAALLATLLDHAAYGLALRAASAEELKARLQLLVERVVGG